MKENTRRRAGIVAGATFGLASFLGGTGCSEFNPIFEPNPISSTHKERGLFKFGQKIEKLWESNKPWTLEDATNTLYVRGESFSEALEHFHIKNSNTYNELYEGTRVEIEFDDPRTGEEIVETQIVANDGTIDSKYFGSFDAFATRTQLDEAITAKAREKFGNSEMEVAVRHVPYPWAERSETFLGYGGVNASNGHASIIPLLNQPLKAQFAALAGPTFDTKYIALIKHATNEETVAKDDSNFVNRVIVYGPTSNFVTGLYGDINFGDKDYLVGLANRPLDNFNAFTGKLGDTLDGVLRLTGGYVIGRGDIDFIMNENVYLESKKVEEPNALDKAVDNTGKAKTLLENVKGIKSALQPAAGGN